MTAHVTSKAADQVVVRPAERADAAIILEFIQDLAAYEKVPEAVVNTVPMIEQCLFGDQPQAYGLICEYDGQPIGFAVYYLTYSTWLGRHGLHLEDLYVSEAFRGLGAGLAIMRYLAQMAVTKGYARFEWQVLDWNQPAIDFYDHIGGKPVNEWLTYRLAGDTLEACAQETGDSGNAAH